MTTSWQPSASIKTLKQRAAIIKKIRDFFAERDVLEVETPLLCTTSVTDPFIESIPATYQENNEPVSFYLQTSPEYAMKRLLAAGSGAIYQITKAFRQGEVGHLHNPEFSMLEWYRPGFDHHALMDEVDALLQHILQCSSADRMTYQALFEKHLDLNPHIVSLKQLSQCASDNGLDVATDITERDTWLMLLMSHCIEPMLGLEKPIFVYDFPASQAALARLQAGQPSIAARFEVYIKGMELANGFHELQDATEQQARFAENNQKRAALNLPIMPVDNYLLAALEHGLPDCAGVALGIDRLIMLAAQLNHIQDVLSFDIKRI
jgi:elongation factor P--(R)-beta-lysine ligase